MERYGDLKMENWKEHANNLKKKILGKKIIGLGYTHFGMYLKLEDETIIVCGSSSGSGVIDIGNEDTELDV